MQDVSRFKMSDGLRVPLPPVDFRANTAAHEEAEALGDDYEAVAAVARELGDEDAEVLLGQSAVPVASVAHGSRDDAGGGGGSGSGAGSADREGAEVVGGLRPPGSPIDTKRQRTSGGGTGGGLDDVGVGVEGGGTGVGPSQLVPIGPGGDAMMSSLDHAALAAVVPPEREADYRDLTAQMDALRGDMDGALNEVRDETKDQLAEFQRVALARLAELQAAFMVEANLPEDDYELVTQLRLHNDLVCRLVYDELKHKKEWMEETVRRFTRSANAVHQRSLDAQTDGFRQMITFLRKDNQDRVTKVRQSLRVEVESRMRLDRCLLAAKMRKLEKLHEGDLKRQEAVLKVQVESLQHMNGTLTHQRNNAEKKIEDLSNSMSFISVVLGLHGPDGEMDPDATVAADAVQKHAERVEELENIAKRAKGKQKIINDLRDQVDRFKKAATSQKHAVEQARKTAEDARAEVASAKQATARVQQQLSDSRKKESELEVELQLKKDEMKRLRRELQEDFDDKMRDERNAFQDKLEEMQKLLTDKELDLKRRDVQLKAAHADVQASKDALSRAEEANTELMHELEQLREAVGKLETEALAEQQRLADEAKAEAERREQEVADAVKEAQRAREEALQAVEEAKQEMEAEIAEKTARAVEESVAAAAAAPNVNGVSAGQPADSAAAEDGHFTNGTAESHHPGGPGVSNPVGGDHAHDGSMPVPSFDVSIHAQHDSAGSEGGRRGSDAGARATIAREDALLTEEEVEQFQEEQREALRNTVIEELRTMLSPKVREDIRSEFARYEAAQVRKELRAELTSTFRARLSGALEEQRLRFVKELETLRGAAVSAVKQMHQLQERLRIAEIDASEMRNKAETSTAIKHDYELQVREKDLLLSQLTLLVRAYKDERTRMQNDVKAWEEAGYEAAQQSMMLAASAEGDDVLEGSASHLAAMSGVSASIETPAAYGEIRDKLSMDASILKFANEAGVPTRDTQHRESAAAMRLRRSRSAGTGVAAARARRKGPDWSASNTWAQPVGSDGGTPGRRPQTSSGVRSRGLEPLPHGVRRASATDMASSRKRRGKTAEARPATQRAGSAHVRTQLKRDFFEASSGRPMSSTTNRSTKPRATKVVYATRGTKSAPNSRPGSAGPTSQHDVRKVAHPTFMQAPMQLSATATL